MTTLPTKFIDILTKNNNYNKLFEAIQNGKMEDVLLGNSNLSIADGTIPVNQDVAMIWTYFRIFAHQNIVNRNLLYISLDKIEPSKDNITLLLAYIDGYLSLKKHNNDDDIPFEPLKLWKKCKDSEFYDSSNSMINHLAKNIVELLPEKDEEPKIVIDNVVEAIEYFTLAYVTRIPKPSTVFQLNRFFNYQLNIFSSLKPVLSKLSEQNLIKYDSDKNQYTKTESGEKLLETIDLDRIFKMLEPKDEKQAFYLKYIEFLK